MEDGKQQQYYNQVEISAADFEIIKATGGRLPQSKREMLSLIAEQKAENKKCGIFWQQWRANQDGK